MKLLIDILIITGATWLLYQVIRILLYVFVFRVIFTSIQREAFKRIVIAMIEDRKKDLDIE